MPSSVGLPPLECCRGTRPSQADSCRPLSKLFASAIDATSALAASGPMPGNLLELPAELAAAMPSLDLRLELVDLLVQFLEVLESSASMSCRNAPGRVVARVFESASGTRLAM